MSDHTAAPCIRCRELVDINQSAIAICVFSHTVGIDQALQSPQARVYVCSMCADAMVKGDEPPKTQPLNYVVFHQIRNMIASDPAIGISAWLELRRAAGLPAPTLTDPIIARAWNEFRQSVSSALPPVLPEPEVLTPARTLLAG
jgi:hypothetical protein